MSGQAAQRGFYVQTFSAMLRFLNTANGQFRIELEKEGEGYYGADYTFEY